MDKDPAATDAAGDEAVGHGVEEGGEFFVGEGMREESDCHVYIEVLR